MKTKRLLMLLGSVCLALMLAMPLVLACAAPAPTPTPTPTPSPTPTPTPTPAPPPTAPEVFEWRFQTHRVPGELGYPPEKKFFEETILEATDGRVKITYHPVGTFVPASELFDAYRRGVLDGGVVCPVYWVDTIPVCVIYTYFPGAFMGGIHQAQYFLHHMGLEEVVKAAHLEFDIMFWNSHTLPASPLTTTPVRTLDDLKGLKIRVFGGLADLFTELGASTVNIPGPEIYTGLATGVIDGALWGGISSQYGMKFHEVAKYYMQPNITTYTDAIYVSKKAWDALPEDLQAILDGAFSEYYWTRTLGMIMEEEREALRDWEEKHGVELVWLDETDQKEVMEASVKVWDKIAAERPEAAKWIELLKDYHRELGYID